MRSLELVRPGGQLAVLCLGAHADDIEIGAGGTLLTWCGAGVKLEVHWCVLSALGMRADEARCSAEAFLAGVDKGSIELAQFKDGYFPHQGAEIKAWIEKLAVRKQPDIVLTHRRDDAHQDHRELSRLTWTVFRDQLILEYEVPKWDGDLGQPNAYVPIGSDNLERKIDLLEAHFPSQRSKDWFDAETFRGLARMRGMECRAAERYAEAFVLRKCVLG